MAIVRTVFDLCRAVESRVSDPPSYVHQLRKKFSKLKAAASQFAQDAPLASTHTNFQQAVTSMNRCVTDLGRILDQFRPAPPTGGAPHAFPMQGESDSLGDAPARTPV
jgi:hypothetical protein